MAKSVLYIVVVSVCVAEVATPAAAAMLVYPIMYNVCLGVCVSPARERDGGGENKLHALGCAVL